MARTHLFVDTNVFLEFYSYPKENLAQLKSLCEHLSADGIWLHLPQQVMNELERNREKRLKTSADQFKSTSHPGEIPQHMMDYPQSEDYRKAIDAASKARNAMINQAATDASNKTLPADKVLEELFEKADRYSDDPDVFARALQRSQKADPPGKPDSVGDQSNWETLLEHLPKEDLHIVSKDGDYFSALNTGLPHPFLAKEWKEKKHSDLYVYKGIKPFLDRYLVTIEEEAALVAQWAAAAQAAAAEEVAVQVNDAALGNEPAAAAEAPAAPVKSTDPEKEEAIEALINSPSFSSTHAAVAKLEEYRSALTTEEVARLFEAAIDNKQINWIASDSDVYAFYTALLLEHVNKVDHGLHDVVAELFGTATENEPDPEVS
ncbi:MAG: PIN domain-containing protein [Pseudomonadota bacterium]|nr:PIN domain-containing protein [Pseudomonadota bacterium]